MGTVRPDTASVVYITLHCRSLAGMVAYSCECAYFSISDAGTVGPNCSEFSFGLWIALVAFRQRHQVVDLLLGADLSPYPAFLYCIVGTHGEDTVRQFLEQFPLPKLLG